MIQLYFREGKQAPDGLFFASPATLTAVVPAGAQTSSVYMFDHAGANLWFADAVKSSNGYSITVAHFSGASLGDDGSDGVATICSWAKSALKTALEDVASVGQKTLDVPAPPSIPMDCPEENTDTRVADVYAKQITNPEMDAITKIIGAARSVELSCSDAEDFSKIVQKMAPLFSRLDQKAESLLKQYANGDNADKYFAVSRALIAIDRAATVAGYRSDPLFLTRISDWALTLRDEYLRRLKEDHDYKAGATVLEIERQAGLLGATVNTDETMDKLEKAMTFELTLKTNIQIPKTATRAGTDYQIEGIVKNLRFVYTDKIWHFDPIEFTMVKGTMNGTDDRHKEEGVYTGPKTYTADFLFDFKPCDEYAEVLINQIGPPAEVWSITTDNFNDDKPEETNVASGPGSPANGYVMAGFSSKINLFPPDAGYLKFVPTPHNRAEIAIEEVYNSSLSKINGDITITLTHKPQ
jgi:hypothetical protein